MGVTDWNALHGQVYRTFKFDWRNRRTTEQLRKYFGKSTPTGEFTYADQTLNFTSPSGAKESIKLEGMSKHDALEACKEHFHYVCNKSCSWPVSRGGSATGGRLGLPPVGSLIMDAIK